MEYEKKGSMESLEPRTREVVGPGGLLSPSPSWDSLPLVSASQSTFGQWLNLVSKFSCAIFQQLEIPNISLSKSLELQI